MTHKPSIENSTVFNDGKRKFIFGMDVCVVKSGLMFVLEVVRSFWGASSVDGRSNGFKGENY